MKKMVLSPDFFVDEIAGGAEIYDDVLIEELRLKGLKVCKFKSQNLQISTFTCINNVD